MGFCGLCFLKTQTKDEIRDADNKLINSLIKSGVLTWEVCCSRGYLRFANRKLILDEDQSGIWDIISHPCFVGVKRITDGLANAWHTLDLDELEAEAEKLNEWFRSLPDW